MAKGPSRTRRVGDLIQAELAEILKRETNDARFSLVTILEVIVSPDLSHAKVFISVLDKQKVPGVIDALNKASKYLRFQLAQRIELRVIPALRFVYDDSVAHGQHISALIEKALKRV